MRPVVRGVATLVLASSLLFTGACGGGNHPGSGRGSGAGSGGGVAEAGSYAVTVHAGTTTVRFDPDRLAGLPSATVQTPDSAGQTTQSGPRLSTVLSTAGVTSYRSVRVIGPSESVTLARAEVGQDLLLATTRRGTVKLAGPGLDPSRWVRDVTGVEVTR